jgi:hypothetical protein
MSDEVDIELEADAARGSHDSRRQSSDVEVQRNVPPMDTRWCGRELDLAEDLKPQMERVLCVAPLRERKLREELSRSETTPPRNLEL